MGWVYIEDTELTLVSVLVHRRRDVKWVIFNVIDRSGDPHTSVLVDINVEWTRKMYI